MSHEVGSTFYRGGCPWLVLERDETPERLYVRCDPAGGRVPGYVYKPTDGQWILIVRNKQDRQKLRERLDAASKREEA